MKARITLFLHSALNKMTEERRISTLKYTKFIRLLQCKVVLLPASRTVFQQDKKKYVTDKTSTVNVRSTGNATAQYLYEEKQKK